MLEKLKAKVGRARKAIAGFLAGFIPSVLSVLTYIKLPENMQWIPQAITAAIPVLVYLGVYAAKPNDPPAEEGPTDKGV